MALFVYLCILYSVVQNEFGISLATKENGRLFILPDDYSLEFDKVSSNARLIVQYFDVNAEQFTMYEFDDIEAEAVFIKKVSL